jgi:hypothetical protein
LVRRAWCGGAHGWPEGVLVGYLLCAVCYGKGGWSASPRLDGGHRLVRRRRMSGEQFSGPAHDSPVFPGVASDPRVHPPVLHGVEHPGQFQCPAALVQGGR